MLFLFPAITYTCLERYIQGALWGSVPKTLNVGLLVAALFHILEFGSVLASEGIEVSIDFPFFFFFITETSV